MKRRRFAAATNEPYLNVLMCFGSKSNFEQLCKFTLDLGIVGPAQVGKGSCVKEIRPSVFI